MTTFFRRPICRRRPDRSDPTVQRQGAFFDWWCGCVQNTLRAETTSAPDRPTWLLYHEALEGHPDNAGQLLWHLGIDITHASAVTNFLSYNGTLWNTFPLTNENLTDERWAFRVWQAEKLLRKMLCGLAYLDLKVIRLGVRRPTSQKGRAMPI